MRRARAVVVALVLGLLLVAGISPSIVHAESYCSTYRQWLFNPNCTYSLDRHTIYRIDNAELRIGYFQGLQYGWGRFVTPEPGATVWFDIDWNGDGIWDSHSRADNDGFTYAHATNWGSDVKAIRIAVRHANNTWSFGPWWSW